ncbi:hypothetical protein FHL15_000336 [Xylaria flabelliformis]|uniref:glucan endo-1,3-beta-D-glucosidase n=1 Tax=Xylaria flabelliformis TaxID=2512241 RepID=A0A553IFM5_9PEZI|nr:hypothetical protein FHL15_000336 [Xylaria flabelliformis]
MHTVVLLSGLVSLVSATKLGFNYGSTFTTGAAKIQSDFEAEFTTAANLKGTKGWTSARLYTTVQGGTASDPISAIPAAIKTKTSLLLGLWASAGDAAFANEILALRTAIDKYGSDFASIVDGISIGSEDLYRNSPQGIAAGSNPGVDPDVLVKYIKQVKDTIAGTVLEGALLGHVDTWTGWDNSSSSVVVDELDWIGMDAYPYFQNTMPNAIGQSKSLFQDALGKTRAAARGKAVWITETGHPVSGKDSGESVASVENAEAFWKSVGCPMFGQINVCFGIIGSELTTTPLFDLSCDDVEVEPSSSAVTSSNTPTSAQITTSNEGIATTKTSQAEPVSTGGFGDGQNDVSSSQSSLEESFTRVPTNIPIPINTGSASNSGLSPSSSSYLSSSSDSDSSPNSGVTSSITSTPTIAAPTSSSTTSTSTQQASAPSSRYRNLGATFVAIISAVFAF